MSLRQLVIGSFFAFVICASAGTVSAQGGCRACDDCSGNQHQNNAAPFAIIGNLDEIHNPCWGSSCEQMQAAGVHKNEHSCGFASALREIRARTSMTASDASDLVEAYPGNVRLASGGRFMQVLDCEREVIAQFAVRAPAYRRPLLWVRDKATLAMSDLRGLAEQLRLNWNSSIA